MPEPDEQAKAGTTRASQTPQDAPGRPERIERIAAALAPELGLSLDGDGDHLRNLAEVAIDAATFPDDREEFRAWLTEQAENARILSEQQAADGDEIPAEHWRGVAVGLGMARQQFTGAVTRIEPTKEQA